MEVAAFVSRACERDPYVRAFFERVEQTVGQATDSTTILAAFISEAVRLSAMGEEMLAPARRRLAQGRAKSIQWDVSEPEPDTEPQQQTLDALSEPPPPDPAPPPTPKAKPPANGGQTVPRALPARKSRQPKTKKPAGLPIETKAKKKTSKGA